MSPTKQKRRLLSSSCTKCLIFLSPFNQFGVSRQIFIEVPNVKFHGNPTSGNRDDTWSTDGQTEGWATLKKLTGALRDYVRLDNKHWHDHAPKSVETIHEDGVTILWNLQVRTDRTILNNKPDIITRDNKHGICTLIDAAILGDKNVIKKEAEKILKYKEYKSNSCGM